MKEPVHDQCQYGNTYLYNIHHMCNCVCHTELNLDREKTILIVCLRIGKTKAYYETMMTKLNGYDHLTNI